ncbi:hypothetical protein CHUAL_005824 [Chamberlinius hualienensis]
MQLTLNNISNSVPTVAIQSPRTDIVKISKITIAMVVIATESKQKKFKMSNQDVSDDQLRGYIKAAEAKKRLWEHKKQMELQKQKEIGYLIAKQETAMQAIRLEQLMKPLTDYPSSDDPLTPQQRKRLEIVLKKEHAWLSHNKV